jgi:plastocyanin
MRRSKFCRAAIVVVALILAACGSPDADQMSNTAASTVAQASIAPGATAQPTTMPSPSATPKPTDAPTATIEPTTAPTTMPSSSATTQPMGGMEHVDIKLFMFDPNPLEIKAGTTVMWMNGDAIEHSVTAGVPDAPSSAFDSGLFAQGGSFSHTFDTPGEYAYFCTRHPSMNGRVIVTE